MKYFIQVKNNQPFEKPFDQNYLIKHFGELAIDSLEFLKMFGIANK